MKVLLLAAGSVAGSTVMLPVSSGGQLTVTAGAVTWRVAAGPRNRPTAVKLAGAADPGAVAWRSRVKAVARYRRIATAIWVPEATSWQPESWHARLAGDGAETVQPAGIGSVTVRY